MPEIQELQASCFVLYSFLKWIRTYKGESECMVQGLWADASQNEQLAATQKPTPSNARICSGLLHRLDASCKGSKFGMGEHRTRNIWPPDCIWKDPKLLQENINNLVLEGIHYDPRNVIMDFKSCWLQVSANDIFYQLFNLPYS